MSDTPRTDEQEFWDENHNDYEGGGVVDADFARELERENAELRIYKERLDWLIQFGGATFYKRLPHSLSEAYIAIDTRRKEDPSGRR